MEGMVARVEMEETFIFIPMTPVYLFVFFLQLSLEIPIHSLNQMLVRIENLPGVPGAGGYPGRGGPGGKGGFFCVFCFFFDVRKKLNFPKIRKRRVRGYWWTSRTGLAR